MEKIEYIIRIAIVLCLIMIMLIGSEKLKLDIFDTLLVTVPVVIMCSFILFTNMDAIICLGNEEYLKN